MKKDTIKLAIGSIVLIAGSTHICDQLGKKSRLIPLDNPTVADKSEPFGYRTLGKAITEKLALNETFFKSPGSDDIVKQRDEAWLKEFLADNAVSAEEAAKLEAAAKPAPKPAATKSKPAAKGKPAAAAKPKPAAEPAEPKAPKPSQILRALGAAGVVVKHGQAIAVAKAKGDKEWDIKPQLVSNYIRDGAGGAGKIAALTKDQIAEYKKLAADPTVAAA